MKNSGLYFSYNNKFLSKFKYVKTALILLRHDNIKAFTYSCLNTLTLCSLRDSYSDYNARKMMTINQNISS